MVCHVSREEPGHCHSARAPPHQTNVKRQVTSKSSRADATSADRATTGPGKRGRLNEELQQRTEQLQESETRFRRIVERIADGIIIVDHDTHIRFVNPAAERLFGRTSAQLLGQQFGLALLSGETTEMDIVRSGQQDAIVVELRAGGTTWDGESAQVISLRDITDRKRAEERAQHLISERIAREQAERKGRRARLLAEAGATLDSSLKPEMMLAGLVDLIVGKLADWCIIDLAEGDVVRRVVAAHVDPGKQALLDELSRRFPPGGGSLDQTERVLRTGVSEIVTDVDGDRLKTLSTSADHARMLSDLGVLSAMTVPLSAREQRLGTITFVCGERNFEEDDVHLAEEIANRAGRALENARLYQAAVAGNKAKADFLAVMSHELRTPLNGILGYTQLLLTGVSGELLEIQRHQLRRIEFSATHLLSIIQEILTYASMETGREKVEPKVVRLGRIIEEVTAVAEPLARNKGLDFLLDVPDSDRTLLIDAGKIHGIMLHLLTNAVKFTIKGHVKLSAALVGSEELKVSVSDTGLGILPEHLSRVFDPFWQAENPLTRQAGGTGLGLTVTQGLVHMLGGRIVVISEAGNGSTFTVYLPTQLVNPAGDPQPE
jgi:signal transduction histidine kinase